MVRLYNPDRAATKRVFGNVVKSVDLLDQETRNIFKPFFIAVEGLFDSDEEIGQAWMSLYKENYRTEFNIIRNVWMKHIEKGLIGIKKLEIDDANSYSIGFIESILNTVKDKLKTLEIGYHNVAWCKNELLTMLNNFLENSDALEELTLRNFELGSTVNEHETMKIFVNGLKNAKTLKTLNIPDNSINEAGAKILAQALREKKTIPSLNISQNALKQKDLEFLIYTLKDNKFITSLNISKNFGYSDEKNIKALANLQYVKTLDISSNNFTPEDIKEFAKILKENKSIETLKFADNNLKGDALEEFLEALKVNKTITSLDIGGNKLQPAGFELLVEALKVNKVLKKLFIYDDWAFESAEYKLRNAIEERGVELEILPYKNEATQ